MKRRRRLQRYVCLPPGGRGPGVSHGPATGLLLGFGVLTALAFAFLASLAAA